MTLRGDLSQLARNAEMFLLGVTQDSIDSSRAKRFAHKFIMFSSTVADNSLVLSEVINSLW